MLNENAIEKKEPNGEKDLKGEFQVVHRLGKYERTESLQRISWVKEQYLIA